MHCSWRTNEEKFVSTGEVIDGGHSAPILSNVNANVNGNGRIARGGAASAGSALGPVHPTTGDGPAAVGWRWALELASV